MAESTVSAFPTYTSTMASFSTLQYGSENNMTSSSGTNRKIMIPILMFSLGVISNILALTLLATAHKEQRQKIFFKLMAGLCITDLIGTCVTSPVVIMVYVTGSDMREDMDLCNYFSFVMLLAGFSTMIIICAMSIERYICICHPCFYKFHMPENYSIIAVLVAWLFAALIASLPHMGLGHNVARFPYTWCFFNSVSRELSDAVFNYTYVIIGLANLIVTFFCNIFAVINICRSNKRQRELNAAQSSTTPQPRSMSQRIAQLNMIAMNIGVTLVFTTCYGPLMITTLLFRTSLVNYMNTDNVSLQVIRLASFNQIFDPLVYILARRDLRWKIFSFFRKILCKGDPSVSQVQRNSLPATDVANGNNRDNMNVSMQSNNRIPGTEMEREASSCSICYHCLCDPPTYPGQRNNTSHRPSMQYQSASCRAAPSERLLSREPGKCVIRQPSRQEEIELRDIVMDQHGVENDM